MLNKFKNNIYTYVSLIGMMLGMILNLVLAFKLGNSNYGIYTIIILYSSLSSVFVELGIGQEIIQAYKSERLTKESLRLLASLISITALLFSLITIYSLPDINQYYGLLYFMPLVTYLYEYTERFIGHGLYSSFVINFYKIIALIYVLIFEINIQILLSSIIITQIIISFLIIIKHFKRKNLKQIQQYNLSINKNVWFSRIITSISQQIDKIILSSFLSLEWFALYSFTNTLTLPIGSYIQYKSADKFKILSSPNVKIDLVRFYLAPIVVIYLAIILAYLLISYKFADYNSKYVILVSVIFVIGYFFQSLYQVKLSSLLFTNNTKSILRVNIKTTISTLIIMSTIVFITGNQELWIGSFVISMLAYFINYNNA